MNNDNDYINDNEYDQDDLYDEEYESEERAPMGKRIIGLIIILVLLIGLIIIGFVMYNQALRPLNPNDTQPQYINIEEGMTAKEVAQLLEDNKIVRNAMVFQSYVGRHSYGGAEIQAAVYELSPSMSVAQIYDKLINGDSYMGSMGSITIPEGFNINEIAQLCEQSGICTKDEYLAEASNITKYKAIFPILSSIPEEEISERTLEGYLYPDTYNAVSEDGTNAAENLVMDQLTKFTEEYSPQLIIETQNSGKNVDDVVTLASIIQLETKLPEDRANVASVFYNRMKNDMPLQSDITIDYIYGTKTPVLTTEQTQVQSPYNTYINLGLPLGPICNPDVGCIEAAIHPAKTNYLYFVADMDTGKLYFNETLDEHNQDVSTYMN